MSTMAVETTVIPPLAPQLSNAGTAVRLDGVTKRFGNTVALPRCSDLDFRSLTEGGVVDLCPSNTAVGVVSLSIDDNKESTFTIPVFNLVPKRGEPARFGFLPVSNAPVFVDTAVRSGEDYAIESIASNITQTVGFISSEVVIWGVPGDPQHDPFRGEACLKDEAGCQLLAESNPPPFFEMPTSCGSAACPPASNSESSAQNLTRAPSQALRRRANGKSAFLNKVKNATSPLRRRLHGRRSAGC